MTICGMLLSGGSCNSNFEGVVIEEALFCDIEEPRKFTQRELDWRAANAPTNLRKDFKTNLSYERECDADT